MSDPTAAIVSLTPKKSDVEIAQEIRDRARPLLDQLCAIMDDATRAGMALNFGVGLSQFGKAGITGLTITKQL